MRYLCITDLVWIVGRRLSKIRSSSKLLNINSEFIGIVSVGYVNITTHTGKKNKPYCPQKKSDCGLDGDFYQMEMLRVFKLI